MSDPSLDSAAGRIVVGVDGSEPSKVALRWALTLATATGSPIDAVSAWQLPPTFGAEVLPSDWDPQADAEKVITETVDAVYGADRPAGLRLITVQGPAAKVLLDNSQDATMLIVGSRGHGGFTGLLLGSVSATCAEHATCPVLVAHGDGPA